MGFKNSFDRNRWEREKLMINAVNAAAKCLDIAAPKLDRGKHHVSHDKVREAKKLLDAVRTDKE